MRFLSDLRGTLQSLFWIGRAKFEASALTASRTITIPDRNITLGAEALPFWNSDGTREDIPLTTNGELPFWLSDGTPANIPVVTSG